MQVILLDSPIPCPSTHALTISFPLLPLPSRPFPFPHVTLGPLLRERQMRAMYSSLPASMQNGISSKSTSDVVIKTRADEAKQKREKKKKKAALVFQQRQMRNIVCDTVYEKR